MCNPLETSSTGAAAALALSPRPWQPGGAPWRGAARSRARRGAAVSCGSAYLCDGSLTRPATNPRCGRPQDFYSYPDVMEVEEGQLVPVGEDAGVALTTQGLEMVVNRSEDGSGGQIIGAPPP